MTYDELVQAYHRLKLENEKLRTEIERLNSRLVVYEQNSQVSKEEAQSKFARIDRNSTKEEKLALFRSLFQGRTDVYAKGWIGKNEKVGYSFACANEKIRNLYRKPEIKCSQCSHRKYLPLTDKVILEHLSVKEPTIVGIYPLLHDETCLIFAVDFDKKGWQEDALALRCVRNIMFQPL